MKWMAPAFRGPGLGAGDDLLPRFALPEVAGGDGVGHEGGAPGIDLTGPMARCGRPGIAHVVVR